MNDFELYTLIFFVIDAYYADNPSDELASLLGLMSPFTFKEIDSADSSIFTNFKRYIDGRDITVANSYQLAKGYIEEIQKDLIPAFNSISKEEWKKGAEEYLSEPHKGMDL